jgi:hypothetical protein
MTEWNNQAAALFFLATRLIPHYAFSRRFLYFSEDP